MNPLRLKNKKWVLVVVFVLMATSAVWAITDYIIPKTWNYKVTVNIDTPEGVKSGSAVREVSNYTNIASWINPDVASRSTSVKGEAVVIDLGKRGVVFALVGHDSYRELYSAFPVKAPASIEGTVYYDSLKPSTTAELKDVRARPKLVTFENLNDPKTIKPIYYGKMEGVLGEGVRLKSITVEITDEPVTWGIEKWLPWIPNYYNKRLDGNRYGTVKATNKTANALSAGAFSTGEMNKIAPKKRL